jgi:hypothetical protein
LQQIVKSELRMSKLSKDKGIFLGLVLTGAGLMSVAMFLHPMSPEDFLGLAASDPLQTVAEHQGGMVALFFWAGALVVIAGFAGLATRLIVALRRGVHLVSPRRLPAH